MKGEGVVDLVENGEVRLFMRYGPLNDQQDGVADIPLTMFPEEQRAGIQRGSIVSVEIDDTLLVRAVRARTCNT